MGMEVPFSSRSGWDRRPTSLAQRRAALLRAGVPLIDLTESNPTRCGFSYPAGDILGAIATPAGLTYEPDPCGLLHAREVVAAAYPGVDASRVVLTASTSEAYGWLFKLLCEEGDEVLTPAPSYPLFDFIAQLEGVRIVRYPLTYDVGWHLDMAPLVEAVHERARALIVVHPNNPTGSFLSAEEIEFLRGFCAKRGLAIISDEVFAGYTLRDTQKPKTLVGGGPALTFSLGGLSKAAGLPQMKLSWIVASGPESLQREALARLEIIGDTFLSVGTPVQRGLGRLLEAGRAVGDQIRDRVRANWGFVRGHAKPESMWEGLEAEAGWYGVVRVPEIMSDEEWALRLLDMDRVHVHPGELFDFPGGGYLVVSLLPRPEEFREGFRRLAARADNESTGGV